MIDTEDIYPEIGSALIELVLGDKELGVCTKMRGEGKELRY